MDIIFEPNITLMSLDDNHAIFAQCHPDTDPHSHDVGPFFYINQYNHCTKILTVPLADFVNAMQRNNCDVNTVNSISNLDSSMNVILLSNTGRCGSTLLTQLFESLPATVAISEPECLMPFAVDVHAFSGHPGFTREDLLR